MIRFVTYSEDNMTQSRRVCLQSALHVGRADTAMDFGRGHVDPQFNDDNLQILSAKRGAGYWLLKPYFIDIIMGGALDGDYAVYADAGCEIIADFKHIIDVMDQDLFLFCNGHLHKEWCKADVMYKINGKIVDDMQVQASFIFIRVTPLSRAFIKEWLRLAQEPGMIDDSPSIRPNVPTFAEHRYDQAILCSLAIRDGIKTHWWPDELWYISQRYRWPNDLYPPMVRHHRFRNKGTNDGNPEWP